MNVEASFLNALEITLFKKLKFLILLSESDGFLMTVYVFVNRIKLPSSESKQRPLLISALTGSDVEAQNRCMADIRARFGPSGIH